jgi:hypothetical protein
MHQWTSIKRPFFKRRPASKSGLTHIHGSLNPWFPVLNTRRCKRRYGRVWCRSLGNIESHLSQLLILPPILFQSFECVLWLAVVAILDWGVYCCEAGLDLSLDLCCMNADTGFVVLCSGCMFARFIPDHNPSFLEQLTHARINWKLAKKCWNGICSRLEIRLWSWTPSRCWNSHKSR